MTVDLRDAIRAELQQQRTRYIGRYANTQNVDIGRAQNAYRLSDLSTCHRTIEAVIRWHDPEDNGRCGICDESWPCSTIHQIAATLLPQEPTP